MTSLEYPENWLTVKQVAGYLELSRQEINRRTKPGHPHFLPSRDRREIDGKPGRLINPRSMSPAAQELWRQHALKNAVKSSAEPAQLGLLPRAEIDRKIA